MVSDPSFPWLRMVRQMVNWGKCRRRNMLLLGYGEDSLTLWALQSHLPGLLCALGEGDCAGDCTAI